MNVLFLAWAYLRFHWGRSLIFVLAGAVILFVPLATQTLLAAGERALMARAAATPLLLGARGSQLDLTMAALYFGEARPAPVPMRMVDAIWDSGLAVPIPLHTRFRAAGYPIVGTTLDYFDFRGLTVARGRGLALLGEAVIGAQVAAALDKDVGDTLVSAPENLFDLDGVYPLEMPIVGVLAPTNSPDDGAIFVDIKTAWVIAGIGHGHGDDMAGQAAAPADPRRDAFRRITPDTIGSFHFHGDPGAFPATAVIVNPNDTRAATILRGRYLDPDSPVQLFAPEAVMHDLRDRVFRISALLNAVTAIVAAAALAALGLALFLGYRLRAEEVATAVKLGARRGMVLRLLAAETVAVMLAAGGLAALGVLILNRNTETWAGWLRALGA